MITGRFTAPADGFYWFHLTAQAPANTMCDYRLIGANHTVSVLRLHTNHTKDTLSRDDFQWLEKGETAYVTSDYPLSSETLAESSFAGFRVDSMFDPFIAFAVGRTKTFSDGYGLIPFQKVLIDSSNSWDRYANEFIVPLSGIYLFTVNTCAVARGQHHVTLTINRRQVLVHSTYVGGLIHDGVETVSRTTMVNLFFRDTVSISLNGGELYSDSSYQTSFMGFLYEPINNVRKVAWSVHNDNNVRSNDPVEFHYVLVNEGSGWYANHRFITPESGVYYVSINVNARSNDQFNMFILHNAEPIVSITRGSDSTGNGNHGRSKIIHLQQGDELRVAMPSNSYFSGSPFKETSFTGFRLFV